uniref:ANF_receptor domain-containing protein n=1 Tax=Angiostrongylus cantonensis TaxID=6313 RepID=A0A158PAA4_ANGCA
MVVSVQMLALDDINRNFTIVYRRQLRNFNKDTLLNILRFITEVSRIIVVCFESAEALRELMISVAEEGMEAFDYMWLVIEIGRKGFDQVWKDTKEIPDGKDDVALRAARNFFVIDREPLNSSPQFVADVKAKMRQPPYNCTDCNDIDPANGSRRTMVTICTYNARALASEFSIEELLMQARRISCMVEVSRTEYYMGKERAWVGPENQPKSTSQVGELADAMLLYANALNRSLEAGLSNPTGKEMVKFAMGTFEGFSGTVTINEHLTQTPVFLVYGLDSNDKEIILMRITEQLSNPNESLIQDLQPKSVIWANHGGSPPLNRPLCDYDGSACPPSFTEMYLAITLVVTIVPVAVAIVAVVLFLRYRKLEEDRLNELWKIPFNTLEKQNTKDTNRYFFYLLGEDSVAARRHTVNPLLTKADCALLRKVWDNGI